MAADGQYITVRINNQLFGLPIAAINEVFVPDQITRVKLAPREDGWRIVARDAAGTVDGLIHLSLDPKGYRADGLRLKLEDFELEMREGTIFSSPQAVGPTVLVFVGDGMLHFTPRPPAEREQLRAYSGQPQMVRKVRTAFVRLHPADLRTRADAERWMDWAFTFQRAMRDVFWGLVRTTADKRDARAIEEGRVASNKLAAEVLERSLEGKAYVTGDTFTMGDIPIGCVVYRYLHMPIERPDLPALAAYHQRLLARPGYASHIAVGVS